MNRLTLSAATTVLALLLGSGVAVPAFGGQIGQWTPIGPGHVYAAPTNGYGAYNGTGRLTAIAVDPTDPQIIYVGSVGQLGHEGCGTWKTTDGGATWAPISDDLATLSVAAIAIDPTNHNRVYIVAADEGLYRSDDAGGSWTHVYVGSLAIRSNTNDGDRVVLLINPYYPNILYLTSDAGVLRSPDGGSSWPISLGVAPATSLVMDPINPDVLYAAIAAKGIYKTVTGGASGGASWVQQTQSPLPHDTIQTDVNILLALSHPVSDASETVYAVIPRTIAGFLGYDVFRTSDGLTWSNRYTCAQTSQDNSCFFVVAGADPADWHNVYLGGRVFFVSQTGGDAFTKVPAADNDRQPASPHGDYWELAIDPMNPAILYAGSDGGIYKSSNYGLEGWWSFIGSGITNVEMYDMALANSATSRAIAGTQDNGNVLYTGSLMWTHMWRAEIQGGDGAAVAIDPTDDDRFYAVFDNRGSPCVSTNGGVDFVDFSHGLRTGTICNRDDRTPCGIWNMTFHLQIHPADPHTLIEACKSLWRTTVNTPPGSWSAIFSPPGQDVVQSAVDPTLDVYYAGTSTGDVFAGPGGIGWERVFHRSTPLFLTDIEVDPAHTDVVYVSFAPQPIVDRNCTGNAGTDRVYQLTRVSSTLPSLSMTARDITGNLTSGLCVNALAVDPHVPRTVYAATNKGVYRGRSNATGGPWIWTEYDNGMPRADVRDFEVDQTSGHIFAATFGRSAFEVAPETTVPVTIDVKPGSVVNPINLKSGSIPVAILSSATFDAPAEVHKTSVTFGHSGDEASLLKCNDGGEDVDGDGLLDQVCHFATGSTGFQLSDTTGILKGTTVEGTPFTGSDSVNILK